MARVLGDQNNPVEAQLGKPPETPYHYPMHISDHLKFRPVGKTLKDLETPVPVIDLARVERNVTRWQSHCDANTFANRPHIKTHKIAGLAKYQLAQGARGITVQKLGEAEVMAAAGITDVLLTFNVMGQSKLNRLATLTKTTSMKVVADNHEMLEGLASINSNITVLVECDTGAARNGVQTPQAALGLAQAIDKTQGLRFGGLMTYPAAGHCAKAASFLAEAKHLCETSGLAVETISTGGSPDMWSVAGLEHATEYRAGTYIYFDRSLTARNTCTLDDCALRVLTTVVSCPTEDRAILDAGTKTLTSDLLGLEGFGIAHDFNDAKVYTANEEHGFLDLKGLTQKPKIGDRLFITPNHVCPVSNLFDEVVMTYGNEILGAVKVDARGHQQ
jgi:D-serine deaminase-like pyridoxal phosphate-dependent protein